MITMPSFDSCLKDLYEVSNPYTKDITVIKTSEEVQLRIPILVAALLARDNKTSPKKIRQIFAQIDNVKGKPFSIQFIKSDREIDLESFFDRIAIEITEAEASSSQLEISDLGTLNVQILLRTLQFNHTSSITNTDPNSVFLETLTPAFTAIMIERNLPSNIKLLIETAPYNTPSALKVIVTIKIHQPVSIEKIAKLLQDDEFEIPDQKWLAQLLDRLRKNGLLIWDHGQFLLTYSGLQSIPAESDRNSSDIQRALELGRRFGYRSPPERG